MSIVLLILKMIAWIVLVVAALVLVALFIPVVLDIRYQKKRLLIMAKFLFLSFTIVDSAKKKRPKEKQEEEKTTEKTADKQKKQKFDIELIKKLLKPGAKAIWSIVKRLKIYDIHIVMVATGNDCADVGIQAGVKWSVIGTVMTILNGVWKNIHYKELTVKPDYFGECGNEEKYSCKIAALPVIIIIAAIVFFIRYLKLTAPRRSSAHSGDEKETRNE